MIEDADESASNVFKNLQSSIEKCGLSLDGLTSIGADNTNVNMGNNHSVYSLFLSSFGSLIKGIEMKLMRSFLSLCYRLFIQQIVIATFYTMV